ncbi:hypothetical protein [Methanogenium sp. MK-MG]|uniref:hypothetical protein n=1 Tax=Methanogenium sp. MK-MG TaxID=2599926 RepID=UPI0013EE1111|nr:hypothetical protein [Methanogenium sp. MK-MG]KAF1076423.1 hypothetical protein MKMG_01501 [Methanogenium sp. MK-MG]
MKQKGPLYLAIFVLILAVMACGCATTDEPAEPTPVITPVPTVEEAWAVTDPIFIKSPSVPDYKTAIRADPITNVFGVYVSLDIDATGMGGNMASEGDNLFIVAFAYNYAAVPKDFTITSYNDIISSGIPYKSMTDRIFPMNVKTENFAVVGLKDGMQINPAEPYNYGVIIMLRDEV